MASYYIRFAKDHMDICDFSDEAAKAMFDYESKGIGDLSMSIFSREKLNGYAVGKHWMDVTVSMWKDSLKTGHLIIKELLNDGYDERFLKRVGVL